MRLPAAALPLILVVAAMASIQCGAALAKSLFPVVGPLGVTALRVSLAALILLAIWRPWRAPPTGSALGWIALYGAVMGAMNLLFYLAVARIPLGIAVALEFTGPLAVALWASRRAMDFGWVALAAGGVALLLPHGLDAQALDPVGILLALGAGACWGLYIIFGKRTGTTAPGQATAIGMTVAAVVAAPFGLIEAGPALFSWAILPLGLAVAVLSSALPYSLEMFALRRMPQRTFGISMSIEPAFGALAGLAFLGERLSLLQTAAIACVIAASVGSAATARPASGPAAPGP